MPLGHLLDQWEIYKQFIQLQEYSKFMQTLDETDYLVIVGYNINDNDNHINALLRNFLFRKKPSHIVFSQFVEKGEEFKKENTLEYVSKKLRISPEEMSEEMKNKIKAIQNYGTTDEILSILD